MNIKLSHELDRRSFIVGAGGALAALPARRFAPREELRPVRAITRPPGFHWFGYYDKLQFDPTSRFVLGMRAGFGNRTPRPDDVIKIGMIDTADGDRWLDSTHEGRGRQMYLIDVGEIVGGKT